MSTVPPPRLAEVVDEGVMLSVVPWSLDGDRVPVVLVHGLASNARLWDRVGAELAAKGHPVLAVDQRGHGWSSKPDSGYDFATVTRDLVRLMLRLDWAGRAPVVVGQSWGGNVVLDLAAHHPDLVGGLVMVDGGTIELSARFADWDTAAAALAPPPLAGTPLVQMEQWLRSNHPDWPEEGIQGTLANMEVLGDGTVRPWLSRDNHMQILRNLWEHHPRELYPEVKSPAVLIMAEDRSNQRWMAGKRDEVAGAASGLRQVTVHWMEGDHDLHAQHPEAVASVIHDAFPAEPGGNRA
ncbi:MAG: alpha/beta fold hydrolase [Acidobacteriota bacterium]|nr:alpha/beta fold hydrolase [Acidobacteriota bacterium]